MPGNKTERVGMTVKNRPGVLGRVVGQIRREGWNIKRLFVDETESGGDSRMEIDIEGTHTKLAQVMDRLLHLDCVVSVSIGEGGGQRARRRPPTEPGPEEPEAEIVSGAPDKKPGVKRILAVNPGSTSTKCAVYDDETAVYARTVRHDGGTLASSGPVLNQKEYRKRVILTCLEEAGISASSLDAVVGRGGLTKPIESGTYLINRSMLEDLQSAAAAIHASALGAVIAAEIASALSIPAYVVDPIVVDEMDRHARLTGMPGIERASVFHALNQKAVARRLAQRIGKDYESARFIVAHLGGGITVGAHRYGRVIDVNDALSGEGPFTPERPGGLPALPLIKMCYSGEYTQEEMLNKVTRNGGMLAYLGTNDLRAVQKMIHDGDEFAALVLDSMAYQVSKAIGAMAAVLDGTVDAIALTGGLAHSNRFTGAVRQKVDRLAPVYVFAGEDEMSALMHGALRVLRGQETAARYDPYGPF